MSMDHDRHVCVCISCTMNAAKIRITWPILLRSSLVPPAAFITLTFCKSLYYHCPVQITSSCYERVSKKDQPHLPPPPTQARDYHMTCYYVQSHDKHVIAAPPTRQSSSSHYLHAFYPAFLWFPPAHFVSANREAAIRSLPSPSLRLFLAKLFQKQICGF
ncbi:hypothetical protein TPHA_0F03490 [Tetrapisispora phaffii CBS 4417]|uniref:Uncharacterized protein n=1 Tax=Tetrapisispora phaffii (strain ATCC 24235 / CBS 4417 / NBRC 1672 / NRRL Y-8282 / UCD 70-5) TaxID=1071381 RepID=G8BUP3_TETPH|nr:hypothetical protein TPHA_0F03490 [Tetrapisispora phaffii CBS 4417]CCE63829.1 hypothetical protein TPHA_0F03490 [Tetrapisispora phaffii CBS 4417]